MRALVVVAVAATIACSKREDPHAGFVPKPKVKHAAPSASASASASITPVTSAEMVKDYDAILGDATEAERLAGVTARMADFFGVPNNHVHAITGSLLRAGIKGDDATKMAQALIDIGVMRSWADAYAVAIVYSLAAKRGYATDEDLDALNEILPRQSMLVGIGKARGVDATTTTGSARVAADLAARKVLATELAQAIADAVPRRFGTKSLGEAALSKKPDAG